MVLFYKFTCVDTSDEVTTYFTILIFSLLIDSKGKEWRRSLIIVPRLNRYSSLDILKVFVIPCYRFFRLFLSFSSLLFFVCTELELSLSTTTGTSHPTPSSSTQDQDTRMWFKTTKYLDIDNDGTSKVVADGVGDVNAEARRTTPTRGDSAKYDNESILKALDDILG